MSGSSLQRRAPEARVGRAARSRRCFAGALGVALLTHAAACAGGPLPPDARNATLATRLARDDARRAQQLAPDLYARAERAAQDARNSRDGAERNDHAARADLLLEAAIAEADRVQAERSAAAADARAEHAVEQRADLERERQEVEQVEQRELAARAARSEAQRVFGVSEAPPRSAAAVPLDGTTAAKAASRTELDAARDRSATWLVDRAALTLAAAIALGLPAQRADAIEHAIAQLTRTPAGRNQSAAARADAAARVLSDAERALGQARKQHAGPTPEEVAALLASASERGLQAQSVDRGVVIGLDAAFSAGSAAPTALGVRLLAAVAALARAHPHGAIQLEARAGAAANSPADRSAHARLERVRAALIGDTEPARIARTTAPAGDAGADQVRVVFAGYIPSAAKMP